MYLAGFLGECIPEILYQNSGIATAHNTCAVEGNMGKLDFMGMTGTWIHQKDVEVIGRFDFENNRP